jgi:hypothetical protein
VFDDGGIHQPWEVEVRDFILGACRGQNVLSSFELDLVRTFMMTDTSHAVARRRLPIAPDFTCIGLSEKSTVSMPESSASIKVLDRDGDHLLSLLWHWAVLQTRFISSKTNATLQHLLIFPM